MGWAYICMTNHRWKSAGGPLVIDIQVTHIIIKSYQRAIIRSCRVMKTFIACKLSDSRLEFLQDGNMTLQVEYEIVTQLCKSKALTLSKDTHKQAGSVSIYKWDAKDFQRYFPIARHIEQMMKTDSSAKREVRDKEIWFCLTFITYL